MLISSIPLTATKGDPTLLSTTRVHVPYWEGIYSPEMTRLTYAEVARRAEVLVGAGFPAVVAGCYCCEDERETLADAAERTGGQRLFVEKTCDPGEQYRRLDLRQQVDSRSDGRRELVEAQRKDFDSFRHPDARIDTEGTVEDAQGRLDTLLDSRSF